MHYILSSAVTFNHIRIKFGRVIHRHIVKAKISVNVVVIVHEERLTFGLRECIIAKYTYFWSIFAKFETKNTYMFTSLQSSFVWENGSTVISGHARRWYFRFLKFNAVSELSTGRVGLGRAGSGRQKVKAWRIGSCPVLIRSNEFFCALDVINDSVSLLSIWNNVSV